jgi:hypothetical protein
MGIGLNLIAMLGVDRFPYQKYMSFGMLGRLITLPLLPLCSINQHHRVESRCRDALRL